MAHRRMQRESQILLARAKLSNDLIDFQSEHGHAQMRKMNQEERDRTIMHRCRLYCTIDLVVVIRAPLAPSTMTHSSSSPSSNTRFFANVFTRRDALGNLRDAHSAQVAFIALFIINKFFSDNRANRSPRFQNRRF